MNQLLHLGSLTYTFTPRMLSKNVPERKSKESRRSRVRRVRLWDHPIPFSQKQVRIIELIVHETERFRPYKDRSTVIGPAWRTSVPPAVAGGKTGEINVIWNVAC